MVIPLWRDFRDLGRCFTRLKLFDRDLRKSLGLDTGLLTMIDLDVVILRPKEFLATLLSKARLQPFLGYRDTKNPRCYSGALYRLDTGHYNSFHEVYDSFRHLYDVSRVTGTTEAFFKGWNANSGFVGSDQCWLTTALGEHSYPDKISHLDGVWDAWQVQELPGGEAPENATAIFINGMRRDPSQLEWQEKHEWVRKYWRDI